MGIEGGSNNNEVQSQEIQQANIEQQAQNQEAHQRSGEELEANSTIDNEGERKQIEGKDDATEEMDSSSSKLEEKDSIEDDSQNNDVQDAETAQTEQSALDAQDTIVSDAATGVEEPVDAEEQQVDALETNNEIVDSANEEDVLEDEEDTEEASLDSLDSINDALEEDADDEQTETSDLENNSKIEDDNSDNESEAENIDNKPESEEADNKPESENTDNKPESEDTDNKPESEDTDNKAESEDADNKPEGEDSVDGKPESEDTDNKTESEEADNKPEFEDTDNKPETEDADNKPESEEADNKPESEDSVDGKPESEDTDNKPESEDTDNKPESEDTDNKPESEDSVDGKPESEDTDNKPESEDTDNKPESEEADNKPESEDTDNKPESEDTDNKPESEEADNKPESEDADNKPEGENTDSKPDGESTDNKPEGDNSDANTDSAESNSDANKKPEKLEDLSWEQINDMMKTPEGKAELMRLNADFRERYEADMWGMTQEEYQDYKAACERYAKEQEAKEKEGNVESPEPSKVQKDADQILDKFREMDGRSSERYASGAKAQELKDISDENSRFIAELKDVRQDVAAEKAAVWNDIAKMNYDGTKESNPGRYQELCDRHRSLEKQEDQLDYAIVKMDMNNWDIAQVTGIEYRDEAKSLEKSDVGSTYEAAEKVLADGVTDNASIMDAYRLGEKLEHDVLPSLDGERREVVSSLTMAEGYRDSYLRENNCAHAEAMSNPRYAENDRYIQSLEAKKADIEAKMVDTVELATALHDQVPLAGSDWKFKVIDNKNGTISVEKTWENRGKSEHSHDGKIRQSETTFYRNALEKKETITMGVNSNSVYSHQFSFQFRGLGYKRDTSFGSEGVKFKNSSEGGLLNFNASVGYKRGTEGKKSTLSADASGSLAQFKDTASLVVNSKEYAKLSAEVSVLKASASAKMDSSGVAKVSASSHIVGGEASVSISGVKVAKVSGAFGEAKASASNDILDMKASASVGDYEKSSSAWDVLKTPHPDKGGESEKHLIIGNIKGSLGNETTLASEKYKTTEGEWKASNVVEQVKKDASTLVEGLKTGHLDINTDTVKGIVKDVEAIYGIKDKGFGVDVSKKPEEVVLGNSGIKEAKVTDRPTDFEAKVVDHSLSPERTSETHEVAQDIKTSLEPFDQSKWDNMSFEQRAEAVDNLTNSVANDLGLVHRPDIKYYQSDNPGDFGGYSASENAIYINANNMDDAAETADTIAHESRHCWQHELAENSPESPEGKLFAENFEDYIEPQDDYLEYRNQPVEADARSYASSITENIPIVNGEEQGTAKENTSPKVDTYKTENIEQGAVFDQVPSDINSKEVSKVEEKVPVSDAVMKSLEGSGLTPDSIKAIRDLPKPDYSKGESVDRDVNKPDPKTYLNPDYYQKHLEPFEKTGCYRIQRTDPMLPDDQYGGVLGHSSGLFVTSGEDMMKALKEADGDVSKLEKIFGMDEGDWGKNPVIIRVDDPQHLRIPDGNEMGAWTKYYIPGGFTSGNQAEAVIDSVPRGEYQVMKFNNPDLMDWMRKGIGE